MIRLFVMVAAVAWAQANWPDQLERDVKAASWEAAARVGAAILDQIGAGKMFTRFSDVPQEIRVRTLYAEALDHTAQGGEARRQRAAARSLADRADTPDLAGETAGRMANLKADVLATQIREAANFPRFSGVLIVAFRADWCAMCKPELEHLAKFSDPRARILTYDADHLQPDMRRYLPIPALQAADLPQLYVVDPAGMIRFHVVGFEEDGFFDRKLAWMVEAALRAR